MKPIRAGHVITQEGNTQGQEVKYLKRETRVSIKIKQEILRKTGNMTLKGHQGVTHYNLKLH